MKKTIKILLILIMAFISFSAISKVEAASASINASKKSVNVGDNVTISVSFNAAAWNLKVSGTGVSSSSYADTTSDGENAKTTKSLKLDTSTAGTKTIKLTGDVSDGSTGATTTINKSVTVTVKKKETNTTNTNNNNNDDNQTTKPKDPEPTFTSVKETVYAKSSANVRSSYSTSSSIIGSLKVGDSITRTGIGSNGWSKISYNGQTAYVSSALITKTKPVEPEEEKEEEKEKEKEQEEIKLQLSSLKIENYELDPEFSKDIYEYALNVENDVEKLEIEAISDDKDVVIEIDGNKELKVGENNITITITKEKTDERAVYTIKTIRADIEEKQVETVVKVNQELLNDEIDKVNSSLTVKEWTIRGIIIFVTILIIIIFILRYLTTRKYENEYEEEYDDGYDYISARQKFNDLNNRVDEEQEKIEQEESIETEVKEEKNVSEDYGLEYRVRRSRKPKGKHF